VSGFKRGDKVRDTETGETYTVASPEDEFGYVAFTRDAPPVEHIRPQFIELIRTEKDRSISDQESAAAQTETTSKETIIIQSTDRAQCANCGHEIQQPGNDISDRDIVRLAELMEVHPVHMKNRRFHTINDLFRWCEEHELRPDEATATWAAFEATYGIQGGANIG